MAGTAATVGVTAALAVLAVGTCAVAGAALHAQRLAGTADAAALAAADTVSGAVPGDPCTAAERVAAAGGARLDACELDGLVATVTVGSAYGGIPLDARARAGPPRR
ncbi:Rv3654c family TadE-like protein [Microbacterium enclense]|uniref:Rv3654c family TadE-like protein n=1 Tax=Microbacterium enclense TaxID=993073 RepID=UPI001F966AD7|nr:helicase [Actinomycetota bacterium]